MFGSKKDIIFYFIVGNLIGWIAAFAGVDLPMVLFLSLVVPPVILVILRVFRLY